MKDLSIYFGEVAYLKPSGELVLEENATNEEKSHMAKVRHGLGVQLFQTPQQETLCKFVGRWVKDKKQGQGECSYPNGDVYKGEFKLDRREGPGLYTWADGKRFEGEWKNDRMEGKGTFTHPSGFDLKGDFKANYFVYSSDLIVNPFIEGQELKEEIRLQEEARKKNARLIEAQQKQVKVHRLQNPSLIPLTLQAINKSNRVGTILTSSHSYLLKADIIRALPGPVVEIDLRHVVNLRKSEGRESVREYLRECTLEVLSNGGCLFMNLDDSNVKYEELYYPDLQEFFNPKSLPATLFKPNVMRRQEVWNSFCGNSEVEMSEEYFFVLWSKTKFDEGLDDQDLLAKFEKKFKKVFSLDTIDLVFCSNRIEEESSYRES